MVFSPLRSSKTQIPVREFRKDIPGERPHRMPSRTIEPK
jgi:hypothetical protein